MTLVLASQSPRRRELLAQAGLGVAGFSFERVNPDIDETPLVGESPANYVARLAVEKAKAGLALCGHIQAPVVLGSDTIVVLDGALLGKPGDKADAVAMLNALSGREHEVMTAVALTDGDRTLCDTVTTKVRFADLSRQDILAYVDTGEPMDKAGAYGIQGLGGVFVEAIDGSYSAVVGLPLVESRRLLAAFSLI
ncbi:nucleoside triphosphate pyrophosphatase [Shewanella amazonensis]|uniref:dTTP/UTP pyrophosphatase n=1 Tax=Shewanella amazonensis (strain ATCC BAA-1098 / SB2B) TaxID=326297 RepID=A1S2S4_SHEAM|nr:nucleoside triphosphate pyrophosphatase [Shewanella amazonensis]ABL98680.1 maf protein [Shewanella amazonensis SB2B]